MEVAIYFLVNKQWLDTTDILMDRCLKFISEKNNEKVIDTNLLFHRKHASKAISLCLYWIFKISLEFPFRLSFQLSKTNDS